jgi:hypothetical protein
VGRIDVGTTASAAIRNGHVAAVMFPAAPSERAELARRLGPGWAAQDGRDARRADAVLVRPCSGQTLSALGRRFPGARIIVVDSATERATQHVGPVQRLIEAGADLYLTGELSPAA